MKSDFLQIPKWRCAGNKEILTRIKESLKNNSLFEFDDDGNIFLIKMRKIDKNGKFLD